MVVATTRFAPLTEQVAAGLNLPDCRVVVVDHPLGGPDEATIVERADAAVERIVTLLTGAGG